ncbi:hypothetical protein CsSME_00050670 [Camellia sinensis var. sinensis]
MLSSQPSPPKSSSKIDIGLKYGEDQTPSLMWLLECLPSTLLAISNVPTRLPRFSPTRVLDFGAGTGLAANLIRPIWLLG